MKFSAIAWLILLPLLPLLGVATVWIARRRGARWAAMVAPRLRSTLIRSASPLPRWIGQCFLLAACAAMIAAMARPQGISGTRAEKTMGRNLLFALDLSRSMRVPDVTPDRLSQAKMIIHEIIEASPNERVGLIGFAGQAYSFAPLTVDHAAVRETVDQIDENWAPVGGSNLAAAVRLATDTFRKTGQKQNALVILSDGEENDGHLKDMISSAESAGVFVVAIAVGTTDGGYVPAPEGPGNRGPDARHGRLLDSKNRPVLSRMQPDTLRKLAEETGGRFTQAGVGTNLTEVTRSVVSGMEQFELEGRQTVVTTEFYQWLLFPALIFLIISLFLNTRWRAITAALCLSSLAISPPAAHAREVNSSILKTPSGGRFNPKTEIEPRMTRMVTDEEELGSFLLNIRVDPCHPWLKSQRITPATLIPSSLTKLADQAILPNQKSRLRYAQGAAAYQSGDWLTARKAFSQALLSNDPETRRAAHLAMANALFETGWKSLGGNPLAESEAALSSDFAIFDALVRKRIKDALEADPDDAPLAPLQKIASDWADAIRHLDSALAIDRHSPAAYENRETAARSLKRFLEILDEERQKLSDSLPPPQSEPPPTPKNDPNSQEKDPKPSDDNSKNPPPCDKPGENPDGTPKKSDDSQNPEKPESGEKPKPKEPKPSPEKPGESPKERAKRLLKENADLEKGPVSPGGIEFRNPEKDW